MFESLERGPRIEASLLNRRCELFNKLGEVRARISELLDTPENNEKISALQKEEKEILAEIQGLQLEEKTIWEQEETLVV